MSPNNWGPPIWTFFHVLTFKIKDERFNDLFPTLFGYVKRICRNLPCPECAQHASQFLTRVNISGIKTRTDFQNLMYFFHNLVNKKKRQT